MTTKQEAHAEAMRNRPDAQRRALRRKLTERRWAVQREQGGVVRCLWPVSTPRVYRCEKCGAALHLGECGVHD